LDDQTTDIPEKKTGSIPSKNLKRKFSAWKRMPVVICGAVFFYG